MKKFLRICCFLLLAISPQSQAQETEMDGGQLLVVGGVASAALGGAAWLLAEKEGCRAGFASHSGRCLSTNTECRNNPSAAVCTYTSKDEDQEKLGQGLVAGGVGAMIVGSIINHAEGVSFRTRWRYNIVEGVPAIVYPLSEKTQFSFGMSGRALDYNGVAFGLKYSL